jgi:hypothetical protein
MDVNKSTGEIEQTVGTALLHALLTELRMQSPRFNTMDEDKQLEVIDRLRLQVADQLHEAITQIAAKSYQTVPANVIAVAFRDKVKVTLELAGMKQEKHRSQALAVAESVATGGGCMLVLCDYDQFTGGMSSVKPTSKQVDWTQPED